MVRFGTFQYTPNLTICQINRSDLAYGQIWRISKCAKFDHMPNQPIKFGIWSDLVYFNLTICQINLFIIICEKCQYCNLKLQINYNITFAILFLNNAAITIYRI